MMFYDDPLVIGLIIVGIIGFSYGISGIRVIRPTTRAVIERFGKYQRFRPSGMTWIAPRMEKMFTVNITEQMTEAVHVAASMEAGITLVHGVQMLNSLEKQGA